MLFPRSTSSSRSGSFHTSSLSVRARAIAGATAFSLGGFAIGGIGAWRPASVYAAGSSPRSFALPCTGAPVIDDTELQAAVANAVDGSVICISQSITLSQTLVLDDTTITLVGDDSTVTLTAPANDRHIRASSGTPRDDTLTVMDLTFRDGYTSYLDTGGAIDTNGVGVIVYRSAFLSNEADRTGGAIAVDSAGVMLTETDFVDNATRDSASSGGAVEADDTVTVNGGHFRNNQSAGRGGAIRSNRAVITTGTVFDNNRSNFVGGAIYSNGTAISLTSTTFTGNQSSTSYGGAVYFRGNGSLDVTGGTFADNTAAIAGGAIAFRGTGPIDLAEVTFLRNSVDSSGGALFVGSNTTEVTVTHTDFLYGTAVTGYGGAIYVEGNSPLHIMGGTFSGNDSAGSGGAIYSSRGDITVSYTSFVRNRSASQRGGAISLMNSSRSLVATNSSFYDNSSYTHGAATYTQGPVTLNFVTAIDDSSASGHESFYSNIGDITLAGSVISPAPGTSACNSAADDSSLNSFVTDSSCGSGDDTINTSYSDRRALGFDDSITADDSVLIPSSTSVLVAAAPFNLINGVTLDQLRATRGPVTTTVGAVQVSSTPPTPPPTPLTPPGAPRDPGAVPGDRSANITWNVPTSPGSFPITTYQIANDVDGTGCLLTVGPDTPLACDVTGLTNGTAYRFRIRALNGAGWSSWSEWSAPVIPKPLPPTTKSIVITGVREGRFARVAGLTTGIQVDQVTTRVKLRGQTDYQTGVPRTVSSEGTFTWQRRTASKVSVYFTADGIRSNRIIIAGR